MYLKKFSLRLFDGEGAAAPSTGAGEATGGNETAAAAQESVTNGTQDTKTEETSTVVSEKPKQEERKNFEDLIKGEYKQDFDKRVQQILNQRFKEYKTLQENAEKSAPLMEALAKRYSKETGDFEGIYSALLNDDVLLESEAIKAGKTLEEYKEHVKNQAEKDSFRRENERLRKQLELREQQEQQERSRQAWVQESEKVKSIYSNFDIQKEVENPAFVDLLRKGVGMQAAFEVIHKDEILSGAMQYTAQKVAEQVANNVKARAARPAENGISGNAATQAKTDVSKLTKADILDIRRRAARGENIRF